MSITARGLLTAVAAPFRPAVMLLHVVQDPAALVVGDAQQALDGGHEAVEVAGRDSSGVRERVQAVLQAALRLLRQLRHQPGRVLLLQHLQHVLPQGPATVSLSPRQQGWRLMTTLIPLPPHERRN